MLFLLLACSDPADPGDKPDDTAGGGDNGGDNGGGGDSGDSGDSGDTGPEITDCPTWSGLRPGVTRTLQTTAEWTRQTSATATWTEFTVADGDQFVYERIIDGSNADSTFWYRNTATYRCDGDGAWLLSETYEQDYQPIDGEPSTLDLGWTWTSDFLYFPRELKVGLTISTKETYQIEGSGSASELDATFRVYGQRPIDTAIGRLTTWDVEQWDAGQANFADPEGRVATYAYELVAYTEE